MSLGKRARNYSAKTAVPFAFVLAIILVCSGCGKSTDIAPVEPVPAWDDPLS